MKLSVCVFLSVCDSCVVVLLEDLERLDDDFLSASARLRSLNASSVARAQLQSLDKSMEDAAVSSRTSTHLRLRAPCCRGTNQTHFPMIQRAIEDYNNTLQDSLSRTDMLEAEISTISEDIDELQNKVRSAHTHTIVPMVQIHTLGAPPVKARSPLSFNPEPGQRGGRGLLCLRWCIHG